MSAAVAAVGRVEVDAARTDQLPLPTTTVPDPALTDVLVHPENIANTVSAEPIPIRSNAGRYTEPNDLLFDSNELTCSADDHRNASTDLARICELPRWTRLRWFRCGGATA